MRDKFFGPLPFLLLAGVFILSACSAIQVDEASSQGDLTQSYEIPGFGYRIDYPEGWTADTRETYTIISELEADNQRALTGSGSVEGLTIGFEHRPLSFLYGLGLEQDATLEGLFSFNAAFFGWQESQVSETTLFGEPALRVNAAGVDRPGIAVMGLVNESAYLLTLAAPTNESLDEFLPAFEDILGSVKAVESPQ